MATTATDSRIVTTFDYPIEETAALLSAESSQESSSQFISSDTQVAEGRSMSGSRLEMLLEQQNILLQRQLELTEKTTLSQEEAFRRKSPPEILKILDPDVKRIFAEWHKHFRKEVQQYIAEARKMRNFELKISNGDLIAPFESEVRRLWQWPDCYRSIAQPIDGVDAAAINTNFAANEQGGTAEASRTEVYDVDASFYALRRQHALEMQNFVVSHQKACFEAICEDLSLPKQVAVLEKQVSTWATDSSEASNPASLQCLQRQVACFVEKVHKDEMERAATLISQDKMPAARSTIVCIRVVCFVLMLLAVASISYEVLLRLFSVLFALGCGLALLWEDLVLCGLRLVLGESLKRFSLLRSIPEHVHVVASSITVCMPTMPTIVW